MKDNKNRADLMGTAGTMGTAMVLAIAKDDDACNDMAEGVLGPDRMM